MRRGKLRHAVTLILAAAFVALALPQAAGAQTSTTTHESKHHELGCTAGTVGGAVLGAAVGSLFGGGVGKALFEAGGAGLGIAEGRHLECKH